MLYPTELQTRPCVHGNEATARAQVSWLIAAVATGCKSRNWKTLTASGIRILRRPFAMERIPNFSTCSTFQEKFRSFRIHPI
jgi:hypothetical protein